ncbi:N-acetyl-gamma-glutamyl-phosphate reductase [uncultured Butyricimonas sp.]|uniref:N-acetyl-gamma-glutamyl-phosphate reductase n=1 Tax=uncultured Butyricimonas sp. TaxID=1268785 RepID=UPI0026DBD57F|nr:N-acetyl-gamma-glutamyl-phosphate reductase [uncultured Butyricimonas sp.]
MIRVGIAGAAGYTAGELIRILVNHPAVELRYLQSESHREEPIGRVHRDLLYSKQVFTDLDFDDIDVLFLCMGHGVSARFLSENKIPSSVRVIDLSNDFRLRASAGNFVYGLPELNKDKIMECQRVANPGCFATAIELALLPFAKSGLLTDRITAFGITGATGAGQRPTEETHYSNRAQNLSVYKVFTHQHLGEIRETLQEAGAKTELDIAFVPVRGCHTRGIMVNVVFQSKATLEELTTLYKTYYEQHPFVLMSDEPVSLKQVVNTNYCFIHPDKEGDNVLVTSMIDNLIKGASGQAVQNMNLMFGLDEMTGLRLKANYF